MYKIRNNANKYRLDYIIEKTNTLGISTKYLQEFKVQCQCSKAARRRSCYVVRRATLGAACFPGGTVFNVKSDLKSNSVARVQS